MWLWMGYNYNKNNISKNVASLIKNEEVASVQQ